MKTIANWTTKQIFSYVHGNHLVYNSCWEDPRLDRQVMQLNGDDDVVLITSAGCNALDYALDRPNSVHAVDMNFRQNALLELKMAGIRRLDFDQFFSLFGDGGNKEFPAWYHKLLRRDLSPISQNYWDKRLNFFDRPIPSASFYHRGTTGAFGKLLVRYCKLARIYSDALRLFSACSLTEQKEIYFGAVKDKFWKKHVKAALQTDVILSMLGVPKAQRDYLERTCARSVSDFMEDCMEAVFTRLPTTDNYFWRLYLFGRYTRDCCPEYLREENFELLKGGLVDRIQVHTNDLTSFLKSHPDSFSHYVLLDHMDWLSHQDPRFLVAEWQEILNKARSSAKMLWRSGGFHVDYVDPLKVEFGGRTQRLGDLLKYDHETAAECHARDRVHTYGSFYIAELAG